MDRLNRRQLIVGMAAVAAAPTGAALAASPLTDRDLRAMNGLLEGFMRRYDVPGLAVTIARRGAIEYSVGLGLADKDRNRPVLPDSSFRIASLSKSVTSVAIFKLVEARRLRLDDMVFAPNGILEDYLPSGGFDEQVRAITIDHLLTHTAGGWPNDQRDPMFLLNDADHRELIEHTLATRPLDHRPGRSYAYSNFGYCLLGRVIERASGTTYEAFVRETVLDPAGARGFRLGGNLLSQAQADEVRYYDPTGWDPYGMNVARMDAHGGWVASAPDIVRFLLSVDGFKSVKDRLSAGSIRKMTTPTRAERFYARGWSVNPNNNWWHVGSLPGTTAIMVRTHHGFCWAALANSRKWDSDINLAMDNLIWEVVGKPRAWR